MLLRPRLIRPSRLLRVWLMLLRLRLIGRLCNRETSILALQGLLFTTLQNGFAIVVLSVLARR
jgi:hypothetical protein